MAAGIRYSFGAFELDPQARRLTSRGRLVALPERHLDVLQHLVEHAGDVRSKDALIRAGWGDVAVTDNSLEQVVSVLRKTLAPEGDAPPLIETVPRRGYRFTAAVSREVARQTDDELEALLAPHRAWIEGRAALESLERDRVAHARSVFERLAAAQPDQALGHIGLANACALHFETTRMDEAPSVAALEQAASHAREACRLDPGSGEAWATLGFVLDRSGRHVDALAALRRAVSLEPDNWRHHFRLSYCSWGEERLRSARRTLALLPGFPLAHWMIATVHVARAVFDQAERELDAGIAVQDGQGEHARFSAVGLHWLRGLLHLARGQHERALASFGRELACEAAGHLYARECCANTWYAIGAVHLRQTRLADARLAFARALERVPHPLARVALDAASHTPGVVDEAAPPANGAPARELPPVDRAVCEAAVLTLRGDHAAAMRTVEAALSAAPAGNAGWLVPLEPLLDVASHAEMWAPVLARLRARAA